MSCFLIHLCFEIFSMQSSDKEIVTCKQKMRRKLRSMRSSGISYSRRRSEREKMTAAARQSIPSNLETAGDDPVILAINNIFEIRQLGYNLMWLCTKMN